MSKEVELLINGVLEIDTDFYDNHNGPYEISCPLCGVVEYKKGGEDFPSMSELKHSVDCIYIVAKKLKSIAT